MRHAFERYATGGVSVPALARELCGLGLTNTSGNRRCDQTIYNMLRNPFYTGHIAYKGQVYPGTHTPLISQELFDAVQYAFDGIKNRTKATKHTFALRDWLTCGECGCKITAEQQRGHVYYRCTHGKGKDACDQRTYTREEALFAEVERILGRIEITPDILEALLEDSRALDAEAASEYETERRSLAAQIDTLSTKASRLLDGFLEGLVPAEAYKSKADQIEAERRGLERRMQGLTTGEFEKTAQVEALARQAVNVTSRFTAADTEGKRRLLSTHLPTSQLPDRTCRVLPVQTSLPSPRTGLERDVLVIHGGRYWD